ncbi:MAG: DUF1572 domain-containing protein [Candidatus Dadabacteria bacterium]
MNIAQEIARHIKEVHFGGNWTDVNLKDTLEGVQWQQAIKQVDSLNTIATLVYHMNYYLNAVKNRVEGKPVNYKHEDSFNHPAINSEEDWKALVSKTFADAEAFADVVKNLPESKFAEFYIEEKNGNYFKNLMGIAEHNHYHLGQIVLLKKILSADITTEA